MHVQTWNEFNTVDRYLPRAAREIKRAAFSDRFFAIEPIFRINNGLGADSTFLTENSLDDVIPM